MGTPVAFQWDETKAAANEAKHGVPFDIAVAVFLDPRRLDDVDDRNDYGEERRNVIGVVDGVCLALTYTMRGRVCRIISARRAHRKERTRYEKA